MLSHWFQKKIKEYQLSRETSLHHDIIRQSFTGRSERGFNFFLDRRHALPAALSLLLIIVLTLSIWGTGISKVNQELPAREGKVLPPSISEPVQNSVQSKPTPRPQEPQVQARLPQPKSVDPLDAKVIEPVMKEEEWGMIGERGIFMEREAKNTILVDKANRRLFVARRQAKDYKILHEFPVSVGLIRGNKVERGDNRTPEGIYRVIDIKFDEELPQIYGPMAFVLSYPNDRDRLLGKTGWGIWLHGTGQKELTPDTKGCVELTDKGIVELSAYIAYNTPIFIFPERRPLVKEGDRIPISLVDGLEAEYLEELPLLKAKLVARNRN